MVIEYYIALRFSYNHKFDKMSLQVKTSLTTYPSSAEIVSEPLGVVLVISAWNYPFCMWKKYIILDIYEVF